MIKRIYVAAPLTQGDQMLNVRRALDAAEQLRLAGYYPFVPHLCEFWHLVYPGLYARWLEYDLAWLEVCDAVLRLPGESKGADREVAEAQKLGLPVFRSVLEVVSKCGKR